jgi:CRP/FNR family transcriptional regulator, cyclic AMP receptor protein
MDPNRLTAIPVFSELSPQEANRLATFATETSAAAGETLIKQGDYSVELIAIEEGTAEVIHNGQRIASLGPGDLVGEMGLLERRPRSADVIASSPMRLIKLTHWEIRRMSPDTVGRIKAMIEQRRQSGVAAVGRGRGADATDPSG